MKAGFIIPALVAIAACAADVEQGPVFLTQGGLLGEFSIPVSSIVDQRFAGVIRQRYDFSCGSAALATLLHYHYDYDVREDNAFRGMWASGDQEQIRKVGFSLLDMKRWLATRGISADGYQVPLDKIAETRIPGIALISVKNYRHFVVVKGVRGEEVLLGDPSAGLTVMPRSEFLAAWNGVYFVLAEDQALARQRFNQNAQWGAFARAPVGSGFSDPLSQQALSLTAPFYGDIS